MPVKMPPGPATMVIAAVTALCWVVAAFSGYSQIAGVLGGFVPARLSGIVDVPGGVPVLLTPLSATLLHADMLHLGFNMLMLIFCGRFVEGALGGRMLVPLYIVGAYVAALAQYLPDPESLVPMIGASGAVSAVVGAYAVLYSRQRVRAIGPLSSHAVRLLWLAAAWVGIQFMIELASFGSVARVAIAAHIGGFLTGLLLARPLLLYRYRDA